MCLKLFLFFLALQFSLEVYKSLINRYVKLQKHNENEEFIYQPYINVKRVFIDEEKEAMAKYCSKASNLYYGICKEEFLKLAYQYAVMLNKTLSLGYQQKSW